MSKTVGNNLKNYICSSSNNKNIRYLSEKNTSEKMNRNYSCDGESYVNGASVGYVNHAMETSDESTHSSACSTTAMVVNNQQTLYQNMMYKKPQDTSASCKLKPIIVLNSESRTLESLQYLADTSFIFTYKQNKKQQSFARSMTSIRNLFQHSEKICIFQQSIFCSFHDPCEIKKIDLEIR